MTYYYEIDEDYLESYHSYLYESHFDYLLAAMSNRVFKMKDNTLYCVSGDQTHYHLDPKEATFILLIAKPYKGKPSFWFDPGHA